MCTLSKVCLLPVTFWGLLAVTLWLNLGRKQNAKITKCMYASAQLFFQLWNSGILDSFSSFSTRLTFVVHSCTWESEEAWLGLLKRHKIASQDSARTSINNYVPAHTSKNLEIPPGKILMAWIWLHCVRSDFIPFVAFFSHNVKYIAR